MHIIFVCTGNTCRSPLAEGYFRKLCQDAGRHDIMVTSAGTAAWNGGGASGNTVAVLMNMGVDMSQFSSTALTPALIRQADLLICMTRAHRAAIGQIAPEALAKTHLLLEFAPRKSSDDISDPFGGSLELYSLCFEDMRPALENLFKHIDEFDKKKSEQ